MLLQQEDPDVVLCDVELPDGNGVDMVERIKELAPMVEVILLTAYGNIPDGVQAIKNGAFAYITKGDDNNKILPLLARAVEKSQIHSRLLHLFQILEYTNGNKAEAARLLGIGIVTLYRKLESYGMKP